MFFNELNNIPSWIIADFIHRHRCGIALFIAFVFSINVVSGLETPEFHIFKNKAWALKIDIRNGSWLELKHDGKVILSNPDSRPSVDLQDDSSWISVTTHLRLKDYFYDERKGELTLTLGNKLWEVKDIICFDANNGKRLKRQAELISKSRLAEKFSCFVFNNYIPKGGQYFFPGTFFYSNKHYWTRISDPLTWNSIKDNEKMRSGKLNELAPKEHLGKKVAITESADGTSSIFLIETRLDPGFIIFQPYNKGVNVKYRFDAVGWGEPGKVQNLGSAWLEVFDGNRFQALKKGVPNLIEEIGLGVPDNVPDWVKDASIYAYKPEKFADQTLQDVQNEVIPMAKAMGFNTIWLLPIQYGTVNYAPIDYYMVEPKIGTWEDYQNLVDACHKAGIRLLQDIVPHGYSLLAGKYRGNSVADFLFTEEGNILVERGFDYNSPSWQEYMQDVSTFYSKKGVDGFRIDSAYGSMMLNWRREGFPDKTPGMVHVYDRKKVFGKADEEYWDESLKKLGGGMPPLPYQRASMASTNAGQNMVTAIRNATQKVKRNNCVLAEVTGMPYTAVADITYDRYFMNVPLKLRDLPSEEFVHRLSLWLEEQKLVESPNALRMRFFASHDEYDRRQLFGKNTYNALQSLAFIVQGVPMCFDGMVQGMGKLIAKLNRTRNQVEELRRGEAFYGEIPSSDKRVFTVLRRMNDKSAVGMINFSDAELSTEITLPVEYMNFKPEEKLVLWDAFSGSKLSSGSIGSFEKIKLTMYPWQTVVLAWRPAGDTPLQTNSVDAGEIYSGETHQMDHPKENGLLSVKTDNYTLSVSSQTGLVSALKNFRGKTLMGNCDMISGPGTPKPSVTVKKTTSTEISAEFDYSEAGRITIVYSCLPDKINIKTDVSSTRRNERATGTTSLILSLNGMTQYQIDCADGMREDWIMTQNKTIRPLKHNLNSRFPEDKSMLWLSTLMPLDLNHPELRFFAKDDASLAVDFKVLSGNPLPRASLSSSFSGEAGAHLAIDIAEKTELNLIPFCNPSKESPTTPYQLGDLSLANESGGWRIRNKHYSILLSRCGGGIKDIRAANGKTILENQEISSTQGFRPGKRYIDCSSDIDTELKILTKDNSVRMVFSSQFRSVDAIGATIPYPLLVNTEYAFDNSPAFSVLSAIEATGITDCAPTLFWNAMIPEGVSAHVSGKEKLFTLKNGQNNGLSIKVSSQAGPLEDVKCIMESDKIKISWLDGTLRSFPPYRLQQMLLHFSLGTENHKYPSIPLLKDQPLNDDTDFEYRGARYSLSQGTMIPFSPYETGNTLNWCAKFSSYPFFGDARNGEVSMRMNYIDPIYSQNLNPVILKPGEYELTYSIKGIDLEPKANIPSYPHHDNNFVVSLKYWDGQGELRSVSDSSQFAQSFDWKDMKMIFRVTAEGYAPYVRFNANINYGGSILLDSIRLRQKQESPVNSMIADSKE